MKTVAVAQREVSNRVTASLAAQFGDPETMDFITRFMPKPEPEPKRRSPDEDFDNPVLRKRNPPRHRPDAGGSLLR
jgi:hypothetical protein